MSRKRTPRHFKLDLRVSEELLDAVNAEVRELERELGAPVTRTTLLHHLIVDGIQRRRAARAQKSGGALCRTTSDAPHPSPDDADPSG